LALGELGADHLHQVGLTGEVIVEVVVVASLGDALHGGHHLGELPNQAALHRLRLAHGSSGTSRVAHSKACSISSTPSRGPSSGRAPRDMRFMELSARAIVPSGSLARSRWVMGGILLAVLIRPPSW